MVTDFKKLSKGEQMFLGSAAILFVTAWLKLWAKVEVPGITVRGNAWESYGALGKLMVLLALAGIVIAVLRAMRTVDIPVVAFPAVGGAVLLLLLIMLLTGPEGSGATGFGGIEISRGLFLFVGLVLGAVMAYGGYLIMQAGETAPSTSPTAPPPTPPTNV